MHCKYQRDRELVKNLLSDWTHGRPPGDLLAEVAGVLEEFSVGETFLLGAQDLRL